MNQLHLVPIKPVDHVWSTTEGQHFVDENGRYMIQPNFFSLYGLDGNLNKLFKDKQPNVLSDVGMRWTSAMYDAYPFFDSLQRDRYGRPHKRFEKTDNSLLAFAKHMLSKFRSGQKSLFITRLSEAATEEVLRRYNACLPEEDYFRVPSPQNIDDVLERLTGSHQQKIFCGGDHSTVYTPIFECFKSLALSDKGSEWLPRAIQSYIDEQEMMVVLAPCNLCLKSRKHSLERWTNKKLLGPLAKKVEAAEMLAFGCKMDMNLSVDINSPQMFDENCLVVRMTSRYMPSSRRTSRDGGGSYYLQLKVKADPAPSIIKKHFLAGLKVGRASGTPIADIKKELFDALKEYDSFGSEPGSEERPRGDPSEERDDDVADATEACIGALEDFYSVSLLDFL